MNLAFASFSSKFSRTGDTTRNCLRFDTWHVDTVHFPSVTQPITNEAPNSTKNFETPQKIWKLKSTRTYQERKQGLNLSFNYIFSSTTLGRALTGTGHREKKVTGNITALSAGTS